MKNSKRIQENQFLIEPLRYVYMLRKNLWLIGLITLLFSGLGISITASKDAKSWSAIAKVIRYDKKISIPSDIPYQFQDFNYETALETIRTRANLEELITDLNLSTTPEELFSQFEIKRGRNSDIIEVIFTHGDKQRAVAGANALSVIFIKNFFTIQNAAIEKISNYYEKSKTLKVQELEHAKKEIALYLSKHNLISLENELQMKYDQLNIIQLQKLQNLTNIETLFTNIKETDLSLQNLPDEVKLRYAVRSAKKKSLEQKKEILQKLKKRYTSSHPKIKALVSEVAQIQRSIRTQTKVSPDEITYGTNPLKSEMQIELSKAKIAYESAKNTDISLKQQVQGLKDTISELSALKKRFDQLFMHKEELQSQLKLVSNRLYDLKMTIGSSKEDFKFFEEAQEPQYPNPSYKKAFVLMFSVLGLIVAFFFLIIREFFNNSIKTRFDLSKRFGIEDVTQLQHDKTLSDNIKHSFSYLANALITEHTLESKIISIGSDIPKAKDSNIASLLLEQLNQQNKKTLHIEITSAANHEETQEHISMQESELHENHINDNIDKAYWYIDTDYSIYTPDIDNVHLFIQRLRELKYDYIVIHAPAFNEAEHLIPLLIALSDTYILATKFGVSSRKVIHKLLKRLSSEDANKLKGVINETHAYFLY